MPRRLLLLAMALALVTGCERAPEAPPDLKQPSERFQQASLARLSGTLDQLDLDPEQRNVAQEALLTLRGATDQQSFERAIEGLREALMPASDGVNVPVCLAAAAFAYAACMATAGGNHFLCSAIAEGILLGWLDTDLAGEALTSTPGPIGLWPPQNNGGCELRAPDGNHSFLWCEPVSCTGNCTLNGVPGGSNNTYWYCTCR